MSEALNSLPAGTREAFWLLVISVLVGVVVDQVLYRFIKSRAARHQWAETGRRLAEGLHGLPSVTGVLLGGHLALARLRLDPAVESLASRAIEILAIIAATAFAARVFARLVRGYAEREGSRLPSTSIFVNLARGLVWVLGGISLLATLGVSIAPLITALGVGGLAVGLALQPTLDNVFSGIQVLVSRQIEPGDLIRLESGEEGTVLDVTWRNTTIRTPSNDLVIVPNAVMGRSRITNYSALQGEHGLTVAVAVPASCDLAQAEQIARGVAEKVVSTAEGVVEGMPAVVRFAGFGTNGAVLNVGVRVHSYPERLQVRHELVIALQRELLEAGIEPQPIPTAPLTL